MNIQKEDLDKIINESLVDLNISDDILSDISGISIKDFFIETKIAPSESFLTLLEANFFSNMANKAASGIQNVGSKIDTGINTVNTDVQTARKAVGGALSATGSKIADIVNPNRVMNRQAPMLSIGNDRGIKYYVFPDLNLDLPGHADILNQIIKDESINGMTAQIVPPGTIGRDKVVSTVRMPPNNQKASTMSILNNLATMVNQARVGLQNRNFISQKELDLIKQELDNNFGKVSSTLSNTSTTETPDIVAKDLEPQINNIQAQPQTQQATTAVQPVQSPAPTIQQPQQPKQNIFNKLTAQYNTKPVFNNQAMGVQNAGEPASFTTQQAQPQATPKQITTPTYSYNTQNPPQTAPASNLVGPNGEPLRKVNVHRINT